MSILINPKQKCNFLDGHVECYRVVLSSLYRAGNFFEYDINYEH